MGLIDADALMEHIEERYAALVVMYGAYDQYVLGHEACLAAIQDAPTVDAVPRSMLDAAIADMPHTCPTCGHSYAVDGEPKSCPVIMQCAKKNCWEWKGLKNG